MDELSKLVSEEIKSEIADLSNLKAGSEEKTKAIDGVTQLYKLKIEETKIQKERDEQRENRKNQIVSTVIGAGVQVILAIGSGLAYDRWFNKGLKFEETGTITSRWLGNVVSKMTPKR